MLNDAIEYVTPKNHMRKRQLLIFIVVNQQKADDNGMNDGRPSGPFSPEVPSTPNPTVCHVVFCYAPFQKYILLFM